MNWSAVDYIVAGALLGFVVASFRWVGKKKLSSNMKLTAIVVIVVLFLLVWLELAVGLVGSPFAGS